MTDKYAMYYWLGRLGRPVAKIYDELTERFGTLENAWEESSHVLRNTVFSCNTLNERFYDNSIKGESLRVCEGALKKNIRLLCPFDDDYPVLLKESSVKPFLLFCKGNIGRINRIENLLGVVGSRNCSAYGRMVTQSLCGGLGDYNFAIVSGLARGIDTVAHKAALDNNMFTVGVLGCGIDFVYPAENSGVYKSMEEKGAIISEYPPGASPFKSNFPARNRIIAGMTSAVLVCEAGLGSGALITAQLAGDEGRDVLAVPSNINVACGSGCNSLIKNGAACVTSYKDILYAYNIEPRDKEACELEISGLCDEEKMIYFYILNNTGNCDDVVKGTGLDVASARRIMTTLEINGYIKRRYDGVYSVGK